MSSRLPGQGRRLLSGTNWVELAPGLKDGLRIIAGTPGLGAFSPEVSVAINEPVEDYQVGQSKHPSCFRVCLDSFDTSVQRGTCCGKQAS